MSSNSSNGHTRLYWAQAAATQLVGQLDANGGVGGASGLHHVGLTTFSGTTSTVRLALGTSTAAQANTAISALGGSGNTPFKTGMSTGAGDLTAHKRSIANIQHVIIFLSDGRPNPDQGPSGAVATNTSGQRPTQTELNSFLGSADKIFSIAVGTGGGSGSNLVDLGLMQLLAKTSGNYHNVVDASLLPTIFSSIFSDIACPVLTITASSDTMVYGSLVPTITPSYSGFVNGDTAASLTTPPTCSTLATSSSPVGPYASSCSGAVDPNYSIVYVDGTVTVTPAPLQITASSGVMVVGGSVPTITPSYAGFVNGDTAASLTTPPTCTTTATSSSPAGMYPSSCSGAVDANYTISYVDGTVTVSDMPILTITASSGTMVAGDPVPTITPSYAGFVDGDTAASLTTPPTCTTTATSSSPVGTYPSSCSGAVDAKYTIVYVPGTVTVTANPTKPILTITASSATMAFGDPAPTITPSYAGFVDGDTAASLTTPPTCTTTATSSSPVGTYPSSCSGAVDAKYTIVYVPGTVTVTGSQSVGGETATPGRTATPPPTSSGSGSSGNSSTPLFALLICLAFGGLGLAAVEAQRRTIRR